MTRRAKSVAQCRFCALWNEDAWVQRATELVIKAASEAVDVNMFELKSDVRIVLERGRRDVGLCRRSAPFAETRGDDWCSFHSRYTERAPESDAAVAAAARGGARSEEDAY